MLLASSYSLITFFFLPPLRKLERNHRANSDSAGELRRIVKNVRTKNRMRNSFWLWTVHRVTPQGRCRPSVVRAFLFTVCPRLAQGQFDQAILVNGIVKTLASSPVGGPASLCHLLTAESSFAQNQVALLSPSYHPAFKEKTWCRNMKLQLDGWNFLRQGNSL